MVLCYCHVCGICILITFVLTSVHINFRLFLFRAFYTNQYFACVTLEFGGGGILNFLKQAGWFGLGCGGVTIGILITRIYRYHPTHVSKPSVVSRPIARENELDMAPHCKHRNRLKRVLFSF